jgi:acetoacetyl-CoA reductase/3-oxoacyl-[acyl-carrier protein] reductase
VTGAAGGIGSAIVERFAREGAVVISVGRTLSKLERLRGDMAALGLATHILAIDCADFAAVEAGHARIERDHGPVDILINNCGQSARQRQRAFFESDPEVWEFLIGTNIRSTFNWSRMVAPSMRARRTGKIINISSESAIFGDPGLVDYAATKGAGLSFTRGLARELAPFGINVNAVSPGITRTPAIGGEGVPPEIVEKALAQVPRGKICEPEDIAGVTRFLASEDARAVVGQNIIVSGGRMMN